MERSRFSFKFVSRLDIRSEKVNVLKDLSFIKDE